MFKDINVDLGLIDSCDKVTMLKNIEFLYTKNEFDEYKKRILKPKIKNDCIIKYNDNSEYICNQYYIRNNLEI